MNICIIDHGQPFAHDTLYTSPLGGTETSILFLAKGLFELNHNVVLTTNTTMLTDNTGKDVLIFPYSHSLNIAREADVVILNRVIPEFIFEIKNKPIYYYTGDAYDQTHIISNLYPVLNRLSGIFFVSEWQKRTFKEYLNIDHPNSKVVYNSFDYDYSFLAPQKNNKIENEVNLIFCSIPYKGIEILYDIHSYLINYYKDNKKINLNVYSSMSLYGQSDLDSKYEHEYKKLLSLPNVNLFLPIPYYSLVPKLAEHHILLVPCTYHETFGINFVLAQSVGCVPVTINSGANSEVNIPLSICNIPTILSRTNFEKYMDHLINIIDTYNTIDKIQFNHVKKFHYIETAKRVLKEII